MKIRRNLFFIIGLFLILINLLVNITNPQHPDEEGMAYKIGFTIGAYFISIIGVVFLILAYRAQKAIKNNKKEILNNDIDNIGKE